MVTTSWDHISNSICEKGRYFVPMVCAYIFLLLFFREYSVCKTRTMLSMKLLLVFGIKKYLLRICVYSEAYIYKSGL